MEQLKLETQNPHDRDKNIEFIENGHMYFVFGKRYETSVTGFVHNFFPKFNADLIIEKMMNSKNWESSPYYGKTPKEIKSEWRLNGAKASKQGTILHKDIELTFNDEQVENDSKEFYQFLNFLDKHKNLSPFRTEWQVYDEELKLAGTVDLLFKDENDEYHIYDWKRSKEIKEVNPYEEGFYPLSHIPHANYWHYSLQLNIYKKILEKNYGIKIKSLNLVQFHPDLDEYNKIPCFDLSDEVDKMFNLRIDELKI